MVQSVARRAPIDLNLLPMFLAVAEASSFAAAAARLGLRRSSVSRGIAAIERALGVQLFSRTTRQVALTTAGAALYARLAPQLSAIGDALGALPEQGEMPSGELRLTAASDVGAVLLPRILAGFAGRYPAVQVDVRLTNRMVDLVEEGFDVALRASGKRLSSSSLVARMVSKLEMQLFGAPTYLARAGTPKTAGDTAEHQWVSHRGGKLPAPLPSPRRKPQIIGDDILFVYEAVKAGLGLGVLPTFLAREDVAAGKLVHVLPRVSVPSGALYVVHPPAQHVPRKVTVFREYLVEHFATLLLAG
ncbi:LysR family transcriptional regulator [Chondromyces apiculatus]|uniref:Transcriptional regulator, LysR family n=1 Tax=Chondromyces apiculatus DSM 436 TaxID=1192034 RepID=A0A017TA67_9BACT|nr:LysR family transcriptional regulator [Chondromyces apiculatus]EYF05506.1 transcriptional regulator, LysR family [Chondromyces apiculatus DSM 436]